MVSITKIEYSRPISPNRRLKDFTNRIVKALTPQIRERLVTVKDCVIFGKKRSGKTWLEKALAEKIVEHYGEENVNVYMSDSFSALVDNIDKPTAKCPSCNSWSLLANGVGNCQHCNEKLDGDGVYSSSDGSLASTTYI